MQAGAVMRLREPNIMGLDSQVVLPRVSLFSLLLLNLVKHVHCYNIKNTLQAVKLIISVVFNYSTNKPNNLKKLYSNL